MTATTVTVAPPVYPNTVQAGTSHQFTFDQVDANHDGVIDRAEFLGAAAQSQATRSELAEMTSKSEPVPLLYALTTTRLAPFPWLGMRVLM